MYLNLSVFEREFCLSLLDGETVQVSSVQYRDYKNYVQRMRRNEGINPETQIRVENMKLWEGLKLEKVCEGFNSDELRNLISEEIKAEQLTG